MNKFLQGINRGAKVEILPDERLRVTRRLDANDIQAAAGNSDKFLANIKLPWGTQDDEFPQCRLIHQDDFGQTENPNKSPNDPPAYIIRVYEQIDASAETPVGNADITYDQYNNKIVTQEWIQFSTGPLDNQTVGTTPAPAPNEDAILKEQIETDDGTVRRIKRVYTTGGVLATDYELNFGGNLILLTITSLNEVPTAPSGYTLFGPGVEYVRGLPLYKYRYSAVNGGGVPGTGAVIDENIEYFYSTNQGVIGITRYTIKYISTLSVISNPITTPAGTELISVEYTDQQGYRLWTAQYAKGTGLISDEQEIHEGGKLIVYKRTAINAVPATPSATIGGTVTLVDDEVQNGTRIEDGTKIYRRVWHEANGTVDNTNTGMADGAIIYRVTTLTAGATTPAYPGSGTAYLVGLKNEARDGYYMNEATYHKPPATQTRRDTIEWQRPGLASFTGTQLTLSPPSTRTLLASVEVSYDVTQDTTVPWEVESYASFVFSYVTTADPGAGLGSQAVSGQKGLGGYLSGATGISGAGYYNGIHCDSYSAVLVSSIPSTRPTGATVLRVMNEPYLTDLTGVVVWKRTKVSYTF